ncbi:hypothetical protein PR048_016246 [Dryococelus australis]|uniref:Uncharacterized protein n=1 Tax=Dryococelus australis TaxID=614101 RepID=A0ABQ9HJ72_9NEOP|nr:hypothetical protein PR048_016246 [Dryococelus australis]
MLATRQKLTSSLSLTEEDDVAVASSDSDQESKSVTSDCAQFLEAIEGRRLFDVAFLFQETSRISQHSKVFHCSFADMQLTKEHRK